MRYPMCCNWLMFRRISEDEYLVEDAFAETSVKMPTDEAMFLQALDGKTNPYQIDLTLDYYTTKELLNYFDDNNLLRQGRLLRTGLVSVIYTLMFLHEDKRLREIAKVLNQLLILLFLPMLLGGLYACLRYGDIEWNFSVFGGFFVGLALGMVLHEAGHAISALAYGARVFEAGLLLKFIFPGAYVMIDDRPVKIKLHRAQIYAAGVEMNLLISGAALCCVAISSVFSGFCLGIAIQNLLLAAVNLLLIKDLDGEKVLGALIGEPNFAGFALNIIFDRDARKALWNNGIHGKAATVACLCLSLVQTAIPVFLISNIISVVLWITELF